jgi:hypothetical protein
LFRATPNSAHRWKQWAFFGLFVEIAALSAEGAEALLRSQRGIIGVGEKPPRPLRLLSAISDKTPTFIEEDVISQLLSLASHDHTSTKDYSKFIEKCDMPAGDFA